MSFFDPLMLVAYACIVIPVAIILKRARAEARREAARRSLGALGRTHDRVVGR